MIRKLALGLVACSVVVGCKGKQTKTDQPVEAPPAPPVSTETIEAAPMNFDPMGSDSGKIQGLVTVHFGFDKSTLDEQAKKDIATNVEWMKANPKTKMQIEGHCDGRGTIEYNVALGERRANTVKSYMINLGVSGERLTVISYGEEKPIDPAESEAAWAKNRRANFVPAQ